MKRVLSVFLVIGVIICVSLYFAGQYPDKLKEYLTPEEPNGDILNNFESISKTEAMKYVNENIFIKKVLNYKDDTLDVHKLITELSNQQKLYVLFSNINLGETYKKEDIEKKALATFGFEVPIVHENYICLEDNIALYNYDPSTKLYTFNTEHPAHGVLGDTFVYNHFLDIQEENNTYVLKVTRIFVDNVYDGLDYTKVYSNYSDKLSRSQNYLFDMYAVYGEAMYDNHEQLATNYFEENYNTFAEKLKTHKFTMRKEDGVISILKYEVE